MTTVTKVLFESKFAEATNTQQYISADVATTIDKFTAMNTSGAPVSLTVNLVPPGSVESASNRTVTKNIAAGTTYTFPEIVGHSLDAGGFISTLAGTAGAIAIRASGRQIT